MVLAYGCLPLTAGDVDDAIGAVRARQRRLI
jgi:hypothetical protein